MADLFISYSRKDRAFVERLHDALEARGKDVWVDWTDIPPTADWFDQITDGIREATSFVFVISPDSLNSDVCARELEYAAETSKRFVPLLARDIGNAALPESVGRHNWIDFTDEAKWDASVQLLAEAIETDLDYLEAHTRWLVDAQRWAEESHSRSLLLRGTELTAAENWLRASADRVPPPAPLHYEYLLASREGATRRQRGIIGAVSVALLVAIGLGILALLQRNEAQDQKRTAQSRELAASSLLNLSTDPELSLLLGIKAAEVEPTDQSTAALRQALLESRVRVALRGSPKGLNDVAVRPDGKVVATGGQDGVVRLWDPTTGKLLHALRGHTNTVNKVAFAPDGKTLFSVAQDNTIRRWNSDTGKPAGKPIVDKRDNRLDDFDISPDGSKLVETNFRYPPRIIALPSGRRIKTLQGVPTVGAGPARFSPDNQQVAIGYQDGTARLFDVAGNAPGVVLHSGANSTVSAIAFAPGGGYLVTAGTDKLIHKWDRSGHALNELAGHQGEITQLQFSHSGDLLASGSTDDTVRLWDTSTDQSANVLDGHRGTILGLAFSPDDAVLASASADDTAHLWDTHSGRDLGTLRGHEGAVRGLAFTPDGSRLVTASDDHTARVWAASPNAFSEVGEPSREQAIGAKLSAAGRMLVVGRRNSPDDRSVVDLVSLRTGRIKRLTLPGFDDVVAVSDDGTKLAVQAAAYGGAPALLDTRTNALGRRLRPSAMSTMAFSPRGGLIGFGTQAGGVGVVDAAGHTRTFAGHPRKAYGVLNYTYNVHFSPDGKRLMSIADDGARLWDVASGRQLGRTLVTPRPPPVMHFGATVAFSPDGRRAVTTVQWSTEAEIWDLRSGQLVESLRGHSGALTWASFSPGGTFVVTAAVDGTARLWDPSTGKTLTVLQPDTTPKAATDVNAVNIAAFTPDGQRLTVAGDRLATYDCSICRPADQLLALAKQRVTRDLTPLERAKYLP